MIIGNSKPIKIIGYSNSTMTQEFVNEITKTSTATVISPDDFLSAPANDYQYIVSANFDYPERNQVIQTIDNLDLDLITVIHDSAELGRCPPARIQPGTFVFAFASVLLGAEVGRHCIIGPYCLIGHHSRMGHNCVTRPGVMISGQSTVGNNCILQTRSTVTNGVSIADNVEVMAFSNVIHNIAVPGRYIGSRARPLLDH